MRNDVPALIVLALLASSVARAGTFDVPYEKPALKISVADRWSPNHSDDGVDAAAPDGAAFFSIYTAEAKDIADVQRQSLAILTRNGMTIKSKLINESPKSFAGLNWTEARYSATEDGRARVVKVEVAPLAAKRYVQLLIWGTPAGVGKNTSGLDKIFATIKLAGR